jgi:uncharacterized membrane protein YtjA (UPF0391 family)
MIHWMMVLLVFAIIAALLGFGGLAGAFVSIAKILAFVFVIIFILGLIYTLITGEKTPPSTTARNR